jgi:N-acetylmuramoyl-L-alanine amidase
MGVPKDYQFDLPTDGRPALFTLEERFFPGIQASWPKCTSRRIFHPIDGIRAVVIHATAGSSSSGAVSVMHAGTASFHWLVPDENEEQHGHFVWACAPEMLAAFHVRNDKSHPKVNGGAKRVNHWSLGIEIVNTQLSDPFSDWQVSMTARIVRFCWAKYPNLKHVVSHARLDPQRRTDPGANFPWEEFKQQVLRAEAEPVPRMVARARAKTIEPVDTEGICTP